MSMANEIFSNVKSKCVHAFNMWKHRINMFTGINIFV